MNYKDIGQRALKKIILAALLLGSVNAAYAVINLDVSFNSEANTTTFEAQGTWEVFVTAITLGSNDNGLPAWSFSAAFFGHGFGKYDGMSGGLSLVSGDAMPTYLPPNVYGADVGDVWGFSASTTYAPTTYVAGEIIDYSYTVSGDVWGAYTASGLSAVYSGGGNVVNVSGSVVPEPSSSAAVAGLCVLLFSSLRRRK